MNSGETLPRAETEDAELGEALHQRLSQLAARLERLTGGRDVSAHEAGESLSDARRASDVVARDAEQRHRPEPPALSDRYSSPAERAVSTPSYGSRQDPQSVAQIAKALRDLDARPPIPARKLEPIAEPQSDHRAAEQRLRAVRERIDALKARHAGPPVGEAEAELEEPKSRRRGPDLKSTQSVEAGTALPPADEPKHGPNRVDFNAAIAEIAARQRMIDESAAADRVAPADPAARPTGRTRLETPVGFGEEELAKTLTNLRQGVDDLSRSLADDRQQDRVAPLSSQEQSAAASGGTKDLAPLSAQADQPTAPVRSPATGINEIAQQILHRMPSSERFDTLSAEIDRLSERIAAADHGNELENIAQRLSSLEQKLVTAVETATVEAQTKQSFAAEMDRVREAIEGLHRMLHNNSSPALMRLEERLSQISDRLESTLEAAPCADMVSDLFRRLELIAARGEIAPAALESLASEIAGLRERERTELASIDTHVQAKAQRLDDAINAQSHGGVASEDLEARIASLSRRLDELAEAGPTIDSREQVRTVEEQIAFLSNRLDQLDAGDSSSEGLVRMEEQVLSLMQRLQLLSTDHDTLRTVQDSMARLEAIVLDSEVQSSDTIHTAARAAVSELSAVAGSQDSAVIEALKSDLRELQEAARSSGAETSDTLDHVHQTLDRVVNRLAGLEGEVRDRTGGKTESSEPTPDRSPAGEPAEMPAGPAQTPASADRPLAPGSQRPEAIPGALTDRDRRADFIAAARRAAQAAAAEHGATKRLSALPLTEEPLGNGPLARLGRVIADRRRPLMIAAIAVVLAIAAIQIVRPIGGSDPADTGPATVTDRVDDAAAAGAQADQRPAALAVGNDANNAGVGDPAAAGASPGAAAFIPPNGVVSPMAEPAGNAAAIAEPAPPAAAASMYPMPDEAIGSVRLRVAAASGDPAALYEVGARFADGRAVDRDLTEAALWLERAAEAGLAVAQHRTATLYEAGLGVPEDRAIAYDWYLAAAEQGNVPAMHNLGVMMSQGIDGASDFTNAIEWFTAAAEYGIRDSQYNLGVIYARGIDQDLAASYQWFALAAAQGDIDAAARRDDIAAELTPDQLAATRAAVSAWTVKGASASANTVEEPEGGWDALDERVSTEDRLQLVRTIQALLAERGFDPGPADGIAGPMTIDAVRAFQATIGLEPTGNVDETLLEVLDQAA